ncbi:hypothetical protein [Pacificibacter marinus]|uniref:Uncharacterized protein n=1 Tax=Pacificibacter marinus TaxID=658057 RepID=A0A1Y5S1N3_9RHOB|nr:hypothetical protein [Pacificibacter marinus]SEK94093.1 hypothetical protein SAMN04488032_108187 [Pacificibacter marinus]SLN30062.1 hypothetical protein PAM7971_01120 [Pacificibacter marinus]
MGIDKVSADILNRTTQILRSGTESDIKRLGQYLTKFKLQKVEPVEDHARNIEEIIQLVEVLKQLKSSEKALELLNASTPNKDFLIRVSREIGLPVVKSDRVEQLKSKIVHEMVESRLNSEAIRNPHSTQQRP